MKNKKLLYGLLGIGAIAGFYFWKKNKTSVPSQKRKIEESAVPKVQITCIKAPC